jgi:hypothetical protein
MGMAARTAVVAGTATAVSGRVARRQAGKAAEQQAEAQQAAAPAPPAEAPAPPPAAPTQGGGSLVDELERLGQLHAQGLLTDDEFTAMKAKLLA